MSQQTPGNDAVLVFPCDIDTKIFIRNLLEDEAEVRAFVETKVAAAQLKSWTSRDSRGGKYLAVTAVVHAESRKQIDDLYRALVAHEKVIMVI